MPFVELSHKIEAGMQTYPGLPEPRVDVLVDYESSRAKYEGKSEFLIASLHLCGNTGTYVDAPIHRHRGATDLAGLALARLAHLPFVVVDVTGAKHPGVDADVLCGVELEGRAVLFRTGFSRHFRTERYFHDNPFLTAAACDVLVAGGAAFVGIDSLNVDDIKDLARPAHTTLLGAGIPVCEHLTNLSALSTNDGRLHAVPIAWVGGATFPVRAYVVT